MLWKTALTLAALAAPAFALEPVTCTTRPPIGFHNVTEVNADGSFCTMLPPYGVQEVAPNEGCSNSYCFGPNGSPTKYTNNTDHLIGPAGLILSTNYYANTTNNFIQITGCMDGSKLGLNPLDEGGQMDSHGWLYQCKGYKKFLSLLEPASNTYCIRCCNGLVDQDCDTSHSTRGCWNLIPGAYQMADGSVCKPPVGAPPAANTTNPAVPGTNGTAPAVPGTNGTVPVVPGTPSVPGAPGASGSAGSSQPTVNKPSGAARFSMSLETVAVAAVAVLAAAAL